jgi:hypothetical protein
MVSLESLAEKLTFDSAVDFLFRAFTTFRKLFILNTSCQLLARQVSGQGLLSLVAKVVDIELLEHSLSKEDDINPGILEDASGLGS